MSRPKVQALRKRKIDDLQSAEPERTHPCRVCVGFGQYESWVVEERGFRQTLVEKRPRCEVKDCKACLGTGLQPLPQILVSRDAQRFEEILEAKPTGYNPHAWLVKTRESDGLILSIVNYGMYTGCGIFYAGAEHFNGTDGEDLSVDDCEPAQLFANGYYVVHWHNASGERQDQWFRDEAIYYCTLVKQ